MQFHDLTETFPPGKIHIEQSAAVGFWGLVAEPNPSIMGHHHHFSVYETMQIFTVPLHCLWLIYRPLTRNSIPTLKTKTETTTIKTVKVTHKTW